jgi:hypothetical protein
MDYFNRRVHFLLFILGLTTAFGVTHPHLSITDSTWVIPTGQNHSPSKEVTCDGMHRMLRVWGVCAGLFDGQSHPRIYYSNFYSICDQLYINHYVTVASLSSVGIIRNVFSTTCKNKKVKTRALRRYVRGRWRRQFMFER